MDNAQLYAYRQLAPNSRSPLTAIHRRQRVLFHLATAAVNIIHHRVHELQQLRTSNILNITINAIPAHFLIPYRMTYKDIIQEPTASMPVNDYHTSM